MLLHVCGDRKSRGRVAFSVIVPRLDCAKQHVFLLKRVSPDFEFADKTLVSFLSNKYDLNSFVQLRQWIQTYKTSTNSSSRASRLRKLCKFIYSNVQEFTSATPCIVRSTQHQVVGHWVPVAMPTPFKQVWCSLLSFLGRCRHLREGFRQQSRCAARKLLPPSHTRNARHSVQFYSWHEFLHLCQLHPSWSGAVFYHSREGTVMTWNFDHLRDAPQGA